MSMVQTFVSGLKPPTPKSFGAGRLCLRHHSFCHVLSARHKIFSGLKPPVPKLLGIGRLSLRQPCFRENKRTVGWASARLLTIYVGMKDLVVDLFCLGGIHFPVRYGNRNVGASLVVAREVDGLFGGYPQGAPLQVCKRYIQPYFRLVVDLFCVGGRLKPTLRGSER